MAKYVHGYLTRDGKFFDSSSHDQANAYEYKLDFIEDYNKYKHKLLYAGSSIPAESICTWITDMPEAQLDIFKALVHSTTYPTTATAKDDDE